MAAKKTKPAPKVKPTQKSPAKVAKKKGTPRVPPMHGKVNHPELDDGEGDETFEIFKSFDRDGSGSIDRGELARLLEALGQPNDEDELAMALDVVDANGSGRISWAEFKAWWLDR